MKREINIIELFSGRIEISIKNSSIVPGSSNLQLRDV